MILNNPPNDYSEAIQGWFVVVMGRLDEAETFYRVRVISLPSLIKEYVPPQAPLGLSSSTTEEQFSESGINIARNNLLRREHSFAALSQRPAINNVYRKR